MVKEDRVTIKIPRPLYKKIKEVIEDSGYSSATDFIIYVLRDLVSASAKRQQTEGLTKKEIETIRQRLKNLGYL